MARKAKLWALWGILVFLLLNYPLLQIFNRDASTAGIPLLVFYLFGVWFLAIMGLYALGGHLTSRK
jgi:hypothetical protein